MSIFSLHRDQLRIVLALQSAMRLLKVPTELTIVGGLGKFLAGKSKRVGDVDILISNALCKRYWDFLEILSLHGIVSFWDVLDRPSFPWLYCHDMLAHARALTLDCGATGTAVARSKLDVCFAESDLKDIPDSTRWVRGFSADEYKGWDDATKQQKIGDGHKEFAAEIKAMEQTLKNIVMHPDLGLQYGW